MLDNKNEKHEEISSHIHFLKLPPELQALKEQQEKETDKRLSKAIGRGVFSGLLTYTIVISLFYLISKNI